MDFTQFYCFKCSEYMTCSSFIRWFTNIKYINVGFQLDWGKNTIKHLFNVHQQNNLNFIQNIFQKSIFNILKFKIHNRYFRKFWSKHNLFFEYECVMCTMYSREFDKLLGVRIGYWLMLIKRTTLSNIQIINVRCNACVIHSHGYNPTRFNFCRLSMHRAREAFW